MKNVRPTMFIMLFAAVPVAASAQVPEATDILASEIETVRQTLGPSIDQQIKIADIGDGNVAVSVLHRGALEDARLADLMQQRVYSLSGGERVRVSLALAFARLPKVLVADEPVVGLTPIDQEMLGQALRRVAARGTAVVTSGHDAARPSGHIRRDPLVRGWYHAPHWQPQRSARAQPVPQRIPGTSVRVKNTARKDHDDNVEA